MIFFILVTSLFGNILTWGNKIHAYCVITEDYFSARAKHNWSKDSNLPDVKGSLSICIARCFATSARGVLPRSDAR